MITIFIICFISLLTSSKEQGGTATMRSNLVERVCSDFDRQFIVNFNATQDFNYSLIDNFNFQSTNLSTVSSLFVSLLSNPEQVYPPQFYISTILLILLAILIPVLICCFDPQIQQQNTEQNENQTCKFFCYYIICFVFALITLSGSALLYLNTGKAIFYVNTSECAWTILLDDLMNGNFSQEKNLFSGFWHLNEKLSILSSNIDGVVDEIEIMETNYTEFLVSWEIIQAEIQDLSNGTNQFSYRSPFNENSTPSNILSQMPGFLSDQIQKIQKKNIEKNLYQIKYNSNYQSYLNTFSIFLNMTDALQLNINSVVSSLHRFSQKTRNSLIDFQDTVNFFESSYSTILLMLLIVQGCLIGFTLPLVITIICIKFNKKQQGGRYLTYFLCGSITLLSIILLLISVMIFISMSMIQSEAQRRSSEILKEYVDEDLSDLFDFESSSYHEDLLPQIAGNHADSIIYLREILKYGNMFNPQGIQFSQWNKLKQTIYNYYDGKQLDFDSQINSDILNQISISQLYQCTNGEFQNDRWMPQKPSSKICQSYPIANCQTDLDVRNSANGCQGCVDSFETLKLIQPNNFSDLYTRYPQSNCNQWIGEIINVWHNFYSIKQENYNNSGLLSKIQAVDEDIEQFKDQAQNLKKSFNSALQNIKKLTSKEIADSTVLFGWSSLPIQEDLKAFSSHFQQLYYYLTLFFALEVVTIIGVIFMMIFVTLIPRQENKEDERQQITKDEMKLFIDIKLI